MKLVKLNSSQFDKFASTHRYRSFYQSSMYAKLMMKAGNHIQFLGIVNERNRLIAYWGESELFELPDGIEEIGNKAFWGARVRRIILSISLKTVAEDSFYWTERLKEIVVPANRIERFKQILPQ